MQRVVRTYRDASGAKGARPVRATSGQREDHTGGTLCRVAGDPHVAPVQKTVLVDIRGCCMQHPYREMGDV